MPESFCFRTPFESQSVHGSQTQLKSARQHFYPNFLLIQSKLSYKTSLLVRSEKLGLFGNTLAANHMYLVIIEGNFCKSLKRHYLKNWKHFL